jgi:hypothetical protein
MTSLDLDLLVEKGEIFEEKLFDDLDEALAAYKDLYERLSVGAEVICGADGESFDFRLGITATPPYIITAQIYLI